MCELVMFVLLIVALSTINRHQVTATMYSVETHYADSDTKCGGTPYRIEVNEDAECSEGNCATSVNGLYDGVASTVCTQDYQNEVWKRFGSSVYLMQVVFHDDVCSNFAYARAYIANSKCEVGSTTNWFIARIETNGSATLEHFTTKSCSPDDLFLSTERASKENLDSNACDADYEYQWFTNKGNTAAPLVNSTTTGSNSSGNDGTSTDATATSSATTTTSTDTTSDTTNSYDSATSPSTSTTDNINGSSSSGGGRSRLSAGAIAGIVIAAIVAIATVYAIIFHRDRPIAITCFSASVT
ncbi:TKL protein kinase [Phytophthora cinnamomi]|uniref:TKL protein kinase n=1 Tax=Phytophthora cinnamomi TaxID=4785 RepID=UPI0035596B45|nr:TKL protein kinase [Phytophthora cinnamomi]